MNLVILAFNLLLGICVLGLLSRKWCLPGVLSAVMISLATLTAAALGAFLIQLSGLTLSNALAASLAQFSIYAACLAYRFYRDPERLVPGEPDVLVSPADGKVIYVKKLPAGQVLQSEKNGCRLVLDELSQSKLAEQELWQIGISMVFTDVHVNRSPMSGRVALVTHRPGRFLSLRRTNALNVNERQTLLVENGGLQLAIIQIASRLVRRIVSYVQTGDQVQRGQRIGMIKFGSQVDFFIPTASVGELCVEQHQRVVAGETVIGRLASSESTQTRSNKSLKSLTPV